MSVPPPFPNECCATMESCVCFDFKGARKPFLVCNGCRHLIGCIQKRKCRAPKSDDPARARRYVKEAR